MNTAIIERVSAALDTLGVKKGDSVLMHTAFSTLGEGITASELKAALLDAVGTEGTIIIPSLSWANVTRKNPVFDINTTGTCIGYFPEWFRSSEGVVRSLHPTHSCAAAGRLADEYTSSHKLDRTPVGENSPFRKLGENDGKILFLGCVSTPNTSMHGVEELVCPDYLFGDDITYSLTGYDGVTYNALYRTHGFAHTVQRYERAEALMNQYELSKGYVLGAYCTLMSAKALWKKGEEALKKNSHYFVDTAD